VRLKINSEKDNRALVLDQLPEQLWRIEKKNNTMDQKKMAESDIKSYIKILLWKKLLSEKK